MSEERGSAVAYDRSMFSRHCGRILSRTKFQVLIIAMTDPLLYTFAAVSETSEHLGLIRQHDSQHPSRKEVAALALQDV